MGKYFVLLQGSLQFVVAFGALIAGAMFILEPSGRLLQAEPALLKNSPFRDFLVPGIILFTVNGVGQAAAGYLTLRRDARSSIVGGIFGLGLIIWMFVQVTLIGGGYPIQNIFFCDRCARNHAGVLSRSPAALVTQGQYKSLAARAAASQKRRSSHSTRVSRSDSSSEVTIGK